MKYFFCIFTVDKSLIFIVLFSLLKQSPEKAPGCTCRCRKSGMNLPDKLRVRIRQKEFRGSRPHTRGGRWVRRVVDQLAQKLHCLNLEKNVFT